MDPLTRPEKSGVTPTLDEVFCPQGVAVVGASPRNLSFAELVVHSCPSGKPA